MIRIGLQERCPGLELRRRTFERDAREKQSEGLHHRVQAVSRKAVSRRRVRGRDVADRGEWQSPEDSKVHAEKSAGDLRRIEQVTRQVLTLCDLVPIGTGYLFVFLQGPHRAHENPPVRREL